MDLLYAACPWCMAEYLRASAHVATPRGRERTRATRAQCVSGRALPSHASCGRQRTGCWHDGWADSVHHLWADSVHHHRRAAETHTPRMVWSAATTAESRVQPPYHCHLHAPCFCPHQPPLPTGAFQNGGLAFHVSTAPPGR